MDFDDADFDFDIPSAPSPPQAAAVAAAPRGTAPIHQPARPQAKTSGATSGVPKPAQPVPQKRAGRQAPSAILVNQRQKGNPILTHIRQVPWEYGTELIPDYQIGATRCALFLSLKYHRLHPEYIYTRMKALGTSFAHRILLTLVDIDNHSEPLKELSKTCLINDFTLILAWRSAEAGRYLESFKIYEHSLPTAIRSHASDKYVDRLTDFVTCPRNINKTDALSLVANFGSVKSAVLAGPEQLALINGWGEKKVQRWCGAVSEPFKIRKAAKKRGEGGREGVPLPRLADIRSASIGTSMGETAEDRARAVKRVDREAVREVEDFDDTFDDWQPDAAAEDTWRADADEWQPARAPKAVEPPVVGQANGEAQPFATPVIGTKRKLDDPVESGVAAALARLRSSGEGPP